jgi:hypothetical protein
MVDIISKIFFFKTFNASYENYGSFLLHVLAGFLDKLFVLVLSTGFIELAGSPFTIIYSFKYKFTYPKFNK